MSTLREWRHSPCLMAPTSAIMLLIILIFSLVTLLLQIPGIVIGILLGPFMSRGNWLVEFLYPWGLARWGHLKLLQWGSKTKNGVTMGDQMLHSRCIEQRTEVVQGRVYIHPLPQLMDNIGYLITCVPLTKGMRKGRSASKDKPPILGILVDVGNAGEVIEQVEMIRDVHYGHFSLDIEIHAILSTHKHHDHTAGNKALVRHELFGKALKQVCGGAIERVPQSNTFVSDGYFISLPCVKGNDMNALVSIECIAAPCHTRGSIVYNLRNKSYSDLTDDMFNELGQEGVFSYLFTGDTMFSGGGGVPFEADIEFPSDYRMEKKTSKSSFKPNAGVLSIERVFAELLRRGISDRDVVPHGKFCGVQQMMLLPGHEYTLDLLQRQFQTESANMNNSGWNKHHPAVFFELASQYFLAGHRRTLPKSTRLLTVPTTMQRELKINPYYRSLKKRGGHFLTSLITWYHHGNRNGKISSTDKTSESVYLTMPLSQSTDILQAKYSLKSPSSETVWNSNHEDLNRSVFTTIYSQDLENIINDLKTGKIESTSAAYKLSKLSEKLEEPTVQRRPVPNTFPSEKKMYLGLVALAVLGSRPSAMTKRDSEEMNMANPVTNTDFLLISKSRLISTLFRLGLFLNCSHPSELRNNDLVQMIDLLWEEAREGFEELRLDTNTENSDLEVQNNDVDNDLLELGALKLILYAVPYNTPSWFSKFCMPCGTTSTASSRAKLSHEKAKNMKVKKRSGGELVKHDIARCPMCSYVLGYPNHTPEECPRARNSPRVQVTNNSPSPPRMRSRSSPPRRRNEGFEIRPLSR
eukprot:CAMPEP_0203675126 /NCGR_PEP_ID=MMETSP0090-20130426/18926_1 /ASSEMBLY_ACC=CAM_ASM_001088 /TAXON_ID=426623 /ORGANISM="Chaetoceros affinis, Strain CCMP159" /LENGTH=806 /DNA_ID=CAMNT_0050541201 /DNA_START=214 /DNA_END=2634 /DNA_ORIENTATION=-